MARFGWTDPLQTAHYYLFDIGPVAEFGITLPIFTPLFGFTTITAPEITLTTKQITEGNKIYPHDAVTGATIGAITLSRGVTALDSDFWRWITAAAAGTTGGDQGLAAVFQRGGLTYRRNLLLVHFFRALPFPGAATIAAATVSDIGIIAGASSSFEGDVAVTAGVNTALNLALVQTIGAVLGDIPPSHSSRYGTPVKVPARAFLLKECIPTRYKAGSDYDASNVAISIAELEMNVHSIEEIALAA